MRMTRRSGKPLHAEEPLRVLIAEALTESDGSLEVVRWSATLQGVPVMWLDPWWKGNQS